jgi:hypothetical protein
MTDLAKLKNQKNFTRAKIADICGYNIRMVQYFLSGEKPTPNGVLEAVNLEPAEDTDKITRGHFVDVLNELGMTPVEAAPILVRHANRVQLMADASKDLDSRIAIRKPELEVLRARGRRNA